MLNNPDFYPTPSWLAGKMIGALKRELREVDRPAILEPSAGKGDILDCLKSSGWECRMYAIESDPDLQATLTGKGYNVIAHDFLSYAPAHRFDGIIMNPPFSSGAKHLLKAWETLVHGSIVCLLNTETLENKYTAERKLLSVIIGDYGQVERMDRPFHDAERKTDVGVSIVTLRKRKSGEDFDFFKDAAKTKEKKYSIDSEEQNELAVRDVIGNLVIEYERVKELFIEYFKIKRKIELAASHVVSDYSKFGEYLNEAARSIYGYRKDQPGIEEEFNQANNDFVDNLKVDAWANVFSMSKFTNLMTSKVKTDFESFQRTHSSLDFTRENIEQLLAGLMSNIGDIRQACIEEVFDYFTKYHKENRIHPEGWVSNDQWMASRKVVLPYIIERWVHGCFHINYGNRDKIRDIDIALNAVTGKRLQDMVTIEDALDREFKSRGTADCGGMTESTHFCPIRYYKKGTVHLTFREEFTWKEFNIRACRMKGWLPGKRSE